MSENDFLEKSLNANKKEFEGLSLADVANPKSEVYKAPETPERPSSIPEAKPKIDEEGLPELITLKTYHGDVEDAVRSNSLSMLKVAVKEQSKKQYTPEETKPKDSGLHIWLIIGASLLFVGGLIAVGYAVLIKNTPETITKQSRDLIFAEKSVVLDLFKLSPREIKSSIEGVSKPASEESIKKIIFVEKTSGGTRALNLPEIMNNLNAEIPPALLRSFSNQFMIGISESLDISEPFMMLISSPDNALPGMLEWERTMGHDLEPIIGSAGADRKLSFKDKIILNHDSRILGDQNGDIFFYSIIDKKIIIIAKSENTFKKILNRIREAKISY